MSTAFPQFAWNIPDAPKAATETLDVASLSALKKELSKKYSKHLSFTKAEECVHSLYQDRLGVHDKSGKLLFDLFKKLIR